LAIESAKLFVGNDTFQCPHPAAPVIPCRVVNARNKILNAVLAAGYVRLFCGCAAVEGVDGGSHRRATGGIAAEFRPAPRLIGGNCYLVVDFTQVEVCHKVVREFRIELHNGALWNGRVQSSIAKR